MANLSRARRKAIKRNAAHHTERTNSTIAPGYLNEVATARYMGVSTRTLQRWRISGDGPAFYKFGERRTLYRREDLDQWALSRRVHSTSETPAVAAE